MIHDILPINSYQGNGRTTRFDFNFYIEDESQLEVYLIDSDDSRVKLVYDVDYSIDEFGNKNGSCVNFPLFKSQYPALKENQRISLEMSLKPIQQIQYNNSSLLNLETIEYSFDYLTRLVQILKRKLELCIKVSEGTGETPQAFLNKIAQIQTECSNMLKQVEQKLQEIDNPNSGESGGGISQSQLQEIAVQLSNLRKDVDALYVTVSGGTASGGIVSSYVVQTYGSPGDSAYCRLWNNGFLEQFINVFFEDKMAFFNSICDLPMSFANKNYCALACINLDLRNDICIARVDIDEKNRVSFTYVDLNQESTGKVSWISLYCFGKAEQ